MLWKRNSFCVKKRRLSKCAGTFCASGQNDEKELRELQKKLFVELVWNVLTCRWYHGGAQTCNIAVNTNESFEPFKGEFLHTKEELIQLIKLFVNVLRKIQNPIAAIMAR